MGRPSSGFGGSFSGGFDNCSVGGGSSFSRISRFCGSSGLGGGASGGFCSMVVVREVVVATEGFSLEGKSKPCRTSVTPSQLPRQCQSPGGGQHKIKEWCDKFGPGSGDGGSRRDCSKYYPIIEDPRNQVRNSVTVPLLYLFIKF